MEEERIRIQDIPVVVSLGFLCRICKSLYDILLHINQGNANEAFNIATRLFNETDSVIDQSVDREAIQRLLNSPDESESTDSQIDIEATSDVESLQKHSIDKRLLN